jgi:phosphoribosylamine---glycine ligase
MSHRVLVVGGGGREHALCWKLAQSPEIEALFCAPGNPGIARLARTVELRADEIQDLADFARREQIDLTVVGPELPLSLGIVDEFRECGLAAFGPTRQAAELESSKVFAKEFMVRHAIPTPEFEIAHTADEARTAAHKLGLPVVLKADGLAAGKGVLIVRHAAELDQGLAAIFAERRFGSAGDRVVVEACLTGEEVSMIALADGRRLLPMAPSKDYKRIGDGDHGPNTGGMGSHSPSGVLDAEQATAILDRVLRPAVEGMAAENRPFQGVLYAGIMLTADGPMVLEFNVRLGDPEAQSLLLRLEDDLLPVLAAGARGEFETDRLHFRREAAACVVLASLGYPGKPVTGERIHGVDAAAVRPGVEVFHAATAVDGQSLVSAGGRVLDVCAVGPDLAAALRAAYLAASDIRWASKVYRTDIGRRVLTRAAAE